MSNNLAFIPSFYLFLKRTTIPHFFTWDLCLTYNFFREKMLKSFKVAKSNHGEDGCEDVFGVDGGEWWCWSLWWWWSVDDMDSVEDGGVDGSVNGGVDGGEKVGENGCVDGGEWWGWNLWWGCWWQCGMVLKLMVRMIPYNKYAHQEDSKTIHVLIE